MRRRLVSFAVGIAAAMSVSAPVGSVSVDDASAPTVLFIRGADRSGGFFEAGDDAARTEQLADVFNDSTASRNHGWGALRATLEREGYEVEQLLEGAEQPGPTEGRPVDLTAVTLTDYDIVVFGSNNAVYSFAHVDALDDYVRAGGAALFISDANFGGSWPDAPNSDQQFLDRYGIEVYQDTGTYRIDDNEFTTPDHPVLAGVDAIDGEGVSPFDVGDATVDVTVLAAAEGNVRLNPGDSQGGTQPAGPDDAAVWVSEVGDGRIAGHFDRNTFFNDNGAGTDLGRFDNERYAINLFAWLAAAAPTPTLGVDSIVDRANEDGGLLAARRVEQE